MTENAGLVPFRQAPWDAAPVVPVRSCPARARRRPFAAGGRLLRLELRRNAMLWMLPIVAALFWFLAYRRSMALPPMWNVRAMTMQGTAVAVFIPTVVGAAAWTGSREGRLGVTELVTGTARPRWFRQLAAWAATTGWAMVAYLGCVAVLYGVTAQQATGGGPLWWPAAVGAASLPALSALGFAAGALRPSRFTTPLVAIGAFVALEATLQLIHGDKSYWQISPLVAGAWELGTTDQGVATFYPYLPDLAIAQLILLAGVTAALLGVVGLPAGSGGPSLRRAAAVITAAGLVVAGTAVAVAGTGRLDAHGMIAIAALHDTANDRPIHYTPVCSSTPIPVCLNPAYSVYLPAVAAALEPVLRDVAGLPGAPVRISQATATYHQGPDNDVDVRIADSAMSGTPPVFHLLLPIQVPGPRMTINDVAAAVRTKAGRDIVVAVVRPGPISSPAQETVIAALLNTDALASGTADAAAARRFAALSADARRAWLVAHLAALRAGRVTLAQLP